MHIHCNKTPVHVIQNNLTSYDIVFKDGSSMEAFDLLQVNQLTRLPDIYDATPAQLLLMTVLSPDATNVIIIKEYDSELDGYYFTTEVMTSKKEFNRRKNELITNLTTVSETNHFYTCFFYDVSKRRSMTVTVDGSLADS